MSGIGNIFAPITRRLRRNGNAPARGARTQRPIAPFLAHLRQTQEYRGMVAAADQATADRFVDNAHAFALAHPVDDHSYAMILEGTGTSISDETAKLRRNEARIERYARRAEQDKFRQGLLDANMQTDLTRDFRDVCDNEFDLAATWIAAESSSLCGRDIARINPTERQQIEYAVRAVVRERDLFLVETLDYLHDNVGDFGAGRRWGGGNSRGQIYGGDGIGRYLQGKVADRARALSNRARRHPHAWYNVAGFQLVANILAHGFADGNGRSVRALYACVLLKHGRAFQGPHNDWIVNEVNEKKLGAPVNPIYLGAHKPNQPNLQRDMWDDM
ncbi:MAG: hypothetical protein AAFP68_17045 [Pseudomonadota bacterium]